MRCRGYAVVRKYMRSHRAQDCRSRSFARWRSFRRFRCQLSAVANFWAASMPTTSRIVAGLVVKRLVRRASGKGDRRCVQLA